MKKSVFIFFLLIVGQIAFSQNKYIDSLIYWLESNPQEDTMRVMTTHRLSYRLSEIAPAESWKYAKETERISQSINFTKGICLANINYAILESNIGNFKNSAEYYLKAIHHAEKINYLRGISISYNNIGDNYLKLKDYSKALEYTNKAFELNKQINELRGQIINLEQMGQLYFLQKEYDKAHNIWIYALIQSKDIQDPNIVAQLEIDLAKYFFEKNNTPKAFHYLKIADSIAYASQQLYLQILSSKTYSLGFQKMKNYESSIKYLQRGLNSAVALGNKTEEFDLYLNLAKDFANIKYFDSAYYYLFKHKILSDSVLNEKNFAHFAFIQTQYETELKDKENKELKSIQKAQEEDIYTKNILLIVSLITLTLTLLSIYLIYRNFKNKKSKLQLEKEKNVSEYNQQVAELEIKSLRSQMNPHFLFNSLNSIRNYIIKNNPQVASNYLANFAALMRKILDASELTKIELGEEIETLKLYIDLELMRFSNKFTYEIVVDDALKEININIPTMILQPFVENAIWHGLLNKEGEGRLIIHFKEIKNEHDEILCEITDNGVGRKATLNNGKPNKHKSKGIIITIERLKKMSENKIFTPVNIIDLEDENGNALGTKVQIYLPVF